MGELPLTAMDRIIRKATKLRVGLDAREALAQTGAAITYREYVVGHKMTAQGMRDLAAWLAEVACA